MPPIPHPTGRTTGRLLTVRFAEISATYHAPNKLYPVFWVDSLYFGVLDGRDKGYAGYAGSFDALGIGYTKEVKAERERTFDIGDGNWRTGA